MHASQKLRESHFAARYDGRSCSLEDVLPRWKATDRLGVVVHEPFGGLGASLMIQAAVSRFYALDPDRRASKAQYPPIFMFHVGGRHGDHSSLDFWPSRREVFLPADPYEVLGAIRDRAITRLLVPDGSTVGMEYAYEAPSGWTDVNSALEQIVSAYVYSPDGLVNDHDVELAATNAQVEDMVKETLDVEGLIDLFERSTDRDLLDLELGPSIPADFHGWLKIFKDRADEVPASQRKEIWTKRLNSALGGLPRQQYRSTSVEGALGRLVPGPAAVHNDNVSKETAHA